MFGAGFSSGGGMRASGRGGGRDRGRGRGRRGGGRGWGGSHGGHGRGSIEFPGQGLGSRGGVQGRGGYGIPRGGNHIRHHTRNQTPNRQNFNGNRGGGTGSQPPPQRPQQGARQTTAGTQGVDQPTGTYNIPAGANWDRPVFPPVGRSRASGGHGVLSGRIERPANAARQTAQRLRGTVANETTAAWDIVEEYYNSAPGGLVPERVRSAFAFLAGPTDGTTQRSVNETGAQVPGGVDPVMKSEPAQQPVNETDAEDAGAVLPFVPGDQSTTSSTAPVQPQPSTEQHLQQIVVRDQSAVIRSAEEQGQYAEHIVHGQRNLARGSTSLVHTQAQLSRAAEATISHMGNILQHGLEQLSRQLADQQRQRQELMIQHWRGMRAPEQQARDEGHDQVMNDVDLINSAPHEAHRWVPSMEEDSAIGGASVGTTTLADRIASWTSATNWRNDVETYVLDQAGLNFDRKLYLWQVIRAALPTSTNVLATPDQMNYVLVQFHTFMDSLETQFRSSQFKIIEKCFDLLDRSQNLVRVVVTAMEMDALEEHLREQIKQCVADSWLEAKLDCIREFRKVWMPMYVLTENEEDETTFARRWTLVEDTLREMLGLSREIWMHYAPVEDDLARLRLTRVENATG